MQTYSEDTIVNDVRIAIDENTNATVFTDSDGNTFDPDTLEMEDIIKSKIKDGINAVRMVAPLHALEMTRVVPTVSWMDKDKGIGMINLPSDFLRLGLFKMSDWAYGVSRAITPTSDEYSQQFSEYKGVRGNPTRPVVSISADAGDGILEFFSCDSANATATLQYVERKTGESTLHKIEENIYRAVVLKTAALAMANYVNADMMQLLNSLCYEQLGISSQQ